MLDADILDDIDKVDHAGYIDWCECTIEIGENKEGWRAWTEVETSSVANSVQVEWMGDCWRGDIAQFVHSTTAQ